MLSSMSYCALASRLGWGSMQVSVAIPAIDKIVTNYINLVADCTGDIIDPEDAVAILLRWKSDSIFDLLVEDDFTTFGTSRLHELRGEIEWFMREYGCQFVEAIKEWYK